jgi:hypothetical protein
MLVKGLLAQPGSPGGPRSWHVDCELPDEPQEVASLETKSSCGVGPITTVGEEGMRQELPLKLSDGVVIPECHLAW